MKQENGNHTPAAWVEVHDADTHWKAERDRLKTINAELVEALEAMPEDPRGCTCLSMTSHNCPFCKRRAVLDKARKEG